MCKQTRGLTKHLLGGVALMLAASLSWAGTLETPVQAAGGGASADEYVKKSDLGFQWNGDARVRVDLRDRSDASESFRPRLRARVRLGAGGEFAEGKFAWGMRLATYGSAVSRNVTLAGGDLNGASGLDIGLDQAWISYLPHPDVTLTVGKMQNRHGASQMVFDEDLTPAGFNLDWQAFRGSDADLLRNVRLTAGYYPIRELAMTSADPYAFLTDLTGTLGKVDLGLGFYYFGGLNAVVAPGGAAGMLQAGTQLRATGLFPHDDMAVLDGRASWAFNIDTFPLKLSGEVMANVTESRRNMGYEARLDLPKFWQGSARLIYRDVAQDATFSPWSDSVLGEGTGYHAGFNVGYQRPLADNVDFNLNWYRFDTSQPLSTGISRTTNRVLADVSARF